MTMRIFTVPAHEGTAESARAKIMRVRAFLSIKLVVNINQMLTYFNDICKGLTFEERRHDRLVRPAQLLLHHRAQHFEALGDHLGAAADVLDAGRVVDRLA